MKKTITLFSLLLLSITMFGQYTAIPDANFENALEVYDDIPNDGQVPTANIASLTSLNAFGEGIADLTGIEDFTSLEILWCSDNDLTSLDVSQNLQLIELHCLINQLTSLNISQNILLEELDVSQNELTSLDVTQHTLLTKLNFQENMITSIDLTQNILLTEIKSSVNNLGALDVSQNVLLTKLRCFTNGLATIDVSQNPLLIDFWPASNNLTSLDLSQNAQLSILNCFNNDITSLDVSLNPQLTELKVAINDLTTLDVSQNPLLTTIWCGSNHLTSLDVRNGNNSNVIDSQFKANSNPNLICISVDDVAYSNTNWTSNIDAQTSFNEDCSLSNEDFNSSSFSLYPNPTSSSFSIASTVLVLKVIIYDSLGRKVTSFNEQGNYNVSNLNAGIYFVSIESENNNQVKKLIVN